MLRAITTGAAKQLSALRRRIMGDSPEGLDQLHTAPGQVAEFALLYEELRIGYLELKDGKWTFRYSKEFLEQRELQPLVAFADPNKVYEAEELWPFFIARIPSIAQPKVLETIRDEGLDAHNAVQLLQRFGKRTISNPFVLEPLHIT